MKPASQTVFKHSSWRPDPPGGGGQLGPRPGFKNNNGRHLPNGALQQIKVVRANRSQMERLLPLGGSSGTPAKVFLRGGNRGRDAACVQHSTGNKADGDKCRLALRRILLVMGKSRDSFGTAYEGIFHIFLWIFLLSFITQCE